MPIPHEALAESRVLFAQVATERPPEGLARGKFAASRFTVVAIAIAIVLGSLTYLLMRAWDARRRKR